MASTAGIIILTVVITVVILIIAFALITYLYLTSLVSQLVQEYDANFAAFCTDLPPIGYSNAVYVPTTNGIYEKPLAKALLDIAFNTTRANCTNLLPLPNPPGFDQQLRLEGHDPFGTGLNMFAYVFWNVATCKACISFTGTSTLTEWLANFSYTLTEATALNGWMPGIQCHGGFYAIYLSIRDALFNWWNTARTYIKFLFITGHSLGGGLSTICAFDFAQEFDGATTGIFPYHYSFGAPRAGNIAFAQTFNSRIPTSLRVGNTEDVIIALPPSSWFGNIFEHTGQLMSFTVAGDSLAFDHVLAYFQDLPVCSQTAGCKIVPGPLPPNITYAKEFLRVSRISDGRKANIDNSQTKEEDKPPNRNPNSLGKWHRNS